MQIMSRAECCLCDEVAAVVAEAGRRRLCTWEKIDVDSDEALSRRYGLDVPVLLIDGEVCCRHRVNALDFEQMLHLKQLERGVPAC